MKMPIEPRWRLVLALLLVIGSQTGCTLTDRVQPDTGHASGDSDAPVMASLLGFEATESALTIDVISSGCTRREDFDLKIETVDEAQVELTVWRLKPDDCRRMPASMRLDYSRDSLGLQDETIRLVNPLVTLPGRG